MNRQTGQAFAIALIIVSMIAAVYLGMSTYAVLRVTEIPPGPPIEPKPSEFGLAYEEVVFPARNDGLGVAGWFIPKEESQSAVILVHGRYENRATAMGGEFPKLAAALHKAGYAVLMIDLRGHGESAPARFDFGIKAQNDVLGAVDWLIENGYQPGNIGALGASLGGGAVNFAAAQEPAIGVVVVDSTYADFSMIQTIWQQESGLPKFFISGTFFIHRILFGFDLRDLTPIEALKSMQPRPYLVVHCRTDQLVPIEQGERLAEEVPGAQHWFVDSGCEHAQIYPMMPEAYENEVVQFFLANLP